MLLACDLDGVLADFHRHVTDLLGIDPQYIPDDEMWQRVMQTPDFWPTIPVKWGADRLWALIQPYDPIVLTGCPRSHFDVAAAHKVEWVHRHFGAHVKVITCLSRNKTHYIESPGDILIDDMSSNVKRWTQAGGIAVHYRTVDQAMADFIRVMKNRALQGQ